MWGGTTLKYILGVKVRNHRQERGLSLKELAEQTGLSASYINEIEKGRKYPKAEKILALSEALEVSYDDLVSLSLDKNLSHMTDLFSSSVLNSFPFQLFGVQLDNVMDLFLASPKKAAALVSTITEVFRAYDMDVEQFFLAALRAYQEMHHNYFEDLEEASEKFMESQGWPSFPPPSREQLEQALRDRQGLRIEETDFDESPHLQDQRYVFLPGPPRVLLIHKRLHPYQHNYRLILQLGYGELGLKMTARTSSWQRAESFEQVMEHFRASYFAGALLLNRFQAEEDATRLFSRKTWSDEALLSILDKHQITAETLLHRLSQLLPGLFDIRELHFLRFDHEVGSNRFLLSKELNMPRKLVPSGGRLNEHHCRRWRPLTLLKEIPKSRSAGEPEYWIGLQRVRFIESGEEVLFLSVARRLRIVSGLTRSVTLGLRVDEGVRQRVQFLSDPAIPVVEVHTTCERCPLPEGECEARSAPPVVYRREQRNLGRDQTLDELTKLYKIR